MGKTIYRGYMVREYNNYKEFRIDGIDKSFKYCVDALFYIDDLIDGKKI